MKTHSGSWWLDAANRFAQLLEAWSVLVMLLFAWRAAYVGDLGNFLGYGASAVFCGWVFASMAESEFSAAERIAVSEYRIQELRKENVILREATAVLEQRAQERAG